MGAEEVEAIAVEVIEPCQRLTPGQRGSYPHSSTAFKTKNGGVDRPWLLT